jgi:hypothetical protein
MLIFGIESEVSVRETHTIYRVDRFPFTAFITVMVDPAMGVHWSLLTLLGHRVAGEPAKSRDDAVAALEAHAFKLIDDFWWFLSRAAMTFTAQEGKGISVTCHNCSERTHLSRVTCPACGATVARSTG